MDSADQQTGAHESTPTPKLHGIIFGSLNSPQVDYGEIHRLATVAIGNLIDAGSTYDQIREELKIIRIDLDAIEEGCDSEKLRGLYDLIVILVEETAERLQIPREIALQKLADVAPVIQPVSVRKSPSAPVIASEEDGRGVQATIGNVRSGINSRTLFYAFVVLGVIAGAGTYLYKNRAGEAEAPVAASVDASAPKPETITTTLTPDQASKLIEAYEGEELSLYGLTSLDAATAEKLATFNGEALFLNGLTSLDAATAEKLAAFNGERLDLSGLTSLDAATAEKLATFKGRVLSLNGLTSLDAATAEKFATFNGEALFLNGLTSLDAATAEKLATFNGEVLFLDGLTSLDAAAAEKLATFEGEELSLDGLTSLDAATAKKLATFEGRKLSLDGLTSLDAATAEKLKRFEVGDKELSVGQEIRTILDAVPAASVEPSVSAPAAAAAPASKVAATSAAAPAPRVDSKLSSGTIRIPIVVKPSAASGGFKIDTNASRSRWEAMGYKVSVSMGLNGKIIRLTDAKGDVYEVAATNLTAETADITAILQSSK